MIGQAVSFVLENGFIALFAIAVATALCRGERAEG
jgi:hypothetical protein